VWARGIAARHGVPASKFDEGWRGRVAHGRRGAGQGPLDPPVRDHHSRNASALPGDNAAAPARQGALCLGAVADRGEGGVTQHERVGIGHHVDQGVEIVRRQSGVKQPGPQLARHRDRELATRCAATP